MINASTGTSTENARSFHQIERFESCTAKIIGIFIFIISISLIFTVSLQILARYIRIPFNTLWTSEIAQYLFVWTSVLGSGLCLMENRHVRVGFIVDTLPFKLQKIIEVFSNLVILVTSYYLIQGIVDLMPRVHGQISPASRIRMSYVYAAGITAGLLFVVFSITRMYRWIRYHSIHEVGPMDR